MGRWKVRDGASLPFRARLCPGARYSANRARFDRLASPPDADALETREQDVPPVSKRSVFYASFPCTVVQTPCVGAARPRCCACPCHTRTSDMQDISPPSAPVPRQPLRGVFFAFITARRRHDTHRASASDVPSRSPSRRNSQYVAGCARPSDLAPRCNDGRHPIADDLI